MRLVPPQNRIAPAIVALMHALGWKHLAIISEEHELFTLVSNIIYSCLDLTDYVLHYHINCNF